MRTLLLSAGFVLALSAPSFAKAKAKAAAPPDDAEIAAIVVAANQVDVDAGKLAQKKGSNDEVKEFASTMVRDHSGVNEQAGALCKKLGVTPKANATSKSLVHGGAQNLAHLKKLKGAAFDKAYVDHEVAYHEAVLKAIDDVLVPNAKNEELKGLIVKVRPVIAEHLDHAKMLADKLGAKK